MKSSEEKLNKKPLKKNNMPKEKRLSKKEREFIKLYLETGNGTKSALEVYDTDKYHTAGVIATENLAKPKIQNAIQEALTDEILAEKHNQLLNASTITQTYFDKEIDDEEIRDFVKDIPGAKLFRIVTKDDKKIAYIRTPDANIRDKALDKAYKIRGHYAPEKKEITGTGLFDPEVKKRMDLLLEEAFSE